MERMKKMFESMLGERNEKEKERIMEQCLSFMKGRASGNDRERELGRFAGRCPEMMESFFQKMRICFAEKAKEEKEGKDGKTEGAECCS